MRKLTAAGIAREGQSRSTRLSRDRTDRLVIERDLVSSSPRHVHPVNLLDISKSSRNVNAGSIFRSLPETTRAHILVTIETVHDLSGNGRNVFHDEIDVVRYDPVQGTGSQRGANSNAEADESELGEVK